MRGWVSDQRGVRRCKDCMTPRTLLLATSFTNGEEPKKCFLSSVSGSSSLDQVLCVFILALYLTLFPPQTNLLSLPSLSCSSLFMNKT